MAIGAKILIAATVYGDDDASSLDVVIGGHQTVISREAVGDAIIDAEVIKNGPNLFAGSGEAELVKLQGDVNSRVHYRLWGLRSQRDDQVSSILYDTKTALTLVGIACEELGLSDAVFNRVMELATSPEAIKGAIMADFVQAMQNKPLNTLFDQKQYRIQGVMPHDIGDDPKWVVWALDENGEEIDIVYEGVSEAECRTWIKTQNRAEVE